ncbi:nucleoporin SEH1 [Rhincodon typus]|uniref:nucleoporin SEH1 n=1 Tax=Rhincodon typus TaxID=259920 RepID=UPI0020309611|nr:nucleoporin SEH1 [Rhincodon typus]
MSMDAFAHQCWIFKNKTIIGPHVTEDLKLMFLPRHSGIFQCVICVSSYPVSSDANTVVRAEALAVRVVITAVAEDPLIEVLAGRNKSLDFGDLVPGSDKALSLKLINRTHSTVPIRLVISANAAAWRCFTFSKPDALAETALRTESTSPLVAPSVMNHVMQASYEGEDPESFILWVHFHAPQKYISNTDTFIIVFSLRKELSGSGGPTRFEIQTVAQFDNHNSQVWRVSWNITGTVLASSGDDGCVRLWKANYMDNWKCTGILKGDGSPVNNALLQQPMGGLGSSAFNSTTAQNALNGTSSAGRKP